MRSKNAGADAEEAGPASTMVPTIFGSTCFGPAVVLLAIVLCCAAPTRAQVASEQYVANFGEAGSSQPTAIVVDSAGNAFVTGRACVDAACTDQEAVTIGYAPLEYPFWKAWLKSPVGVAQGVDIGIDAASNSYVLYLLWQKRDSSNQLTDPDVVTAKYNADGVRQWINYLSSTSAVTRTPVKLSVSPSGDVYVSTIAASVPANTKSSVLTIKYSTTGQMQWAQVSPPESNPLSVPIGIQQDSQENVYVLVKSSCPSSGSVSSIILKYASNGTLLKSFGSEQIGDPVAFQVSPAGNSYAVGFTPAAPGATGNVMLAKFNPDGTLAWSSDLGSTTGSPAVPQPVALALDPKEDVFLGSEMVGSDMAAARMVATKFDTGGSHLWTSTYDETVVTDADSVITIVANIFGDLFVLGKSETTSDSTRVPQILTVKFGLSGNVIWTERYSADPAGDSPVSLATAGGQNPFIAATRTASPTHTDWVTIDYLESGATFNVSEIDVSGGQFTASVINATEEELTNVSLNIINFDLVESNCTGTLAPGASCQFTVGFEDLDFEPDGFAAVFYNWAGLFQGQSIPIL